MQKKPKVKLSKKELKEKYPVKISVGEEVVSFTGKLFLIFGIIILIALAVDIYQFGH